MQNKLPSSIISLIHYSKLNERGWWEKSISNIIIGLISEKDNLPVTKDIIFKRLKDCQINIDKARFNKQVEKLVKKNSLRENGEEFFVSEKSFLEFKEALSEQTTVEEYAKNKFIQLSLSECSHINGEKLWFDFNQQLLIPLVKENGVRIRDFVNVGGKEVATTNKFQNFIEKFDIDDIAISNLITHFLSPGDKKIKAFIIRLLNAYFFVEASNLSQNALKEIYHLSEGKKSDLNIYIDTNFLFSMLDIHANSHNEATNALLSVIEQAKERINIQFRILPRTIEEVEKVVIANKLSLKNYVIDSINLLNRAQEIIPYGFKKKYFEKCKQAGIRIDINQYFEPYEKNLLITIENRLGVNVDNTNYSIFIDDFKSYQYVEINDETLKMLDYRIEQMKQRGFYKETYRDKLYDKILHDMRLWHIVASKRRANATPRSIKNWIITLDSKLLAYDYRKQKKRNKPAICLQPSDLMNMLQFYLPRDENLETAMFENFRLPLMFKDYDEESEKISLSILSAIALFENSENIKKQTIIDYETNNAIRSKIKSHTSIEEIAKIIKEYDELEAHRLKENLKQKNEEIKKREQEQKAKEKEREEESIRLEQQRLKSELESERKIQHHNLEKLEDKLSHKRVELQKIKKQKEIAENRIKKEYKKWLNLFSDKSQIRLSILSEYPDIDRISIIENEINTVLERINRLKNPILIKCENKNDKLFNLLGFEGIKFVGVNNSYDVFMNAKSNLEQICIRDRDFLSDLEVERLSIKYPNLFILGYYCFENYLYHPDNIAEVSGHNIDIEKYRNDIISQVKDSCKKISPNIERDRKGYPEIKIENIKDKKSGSFIYECLHSNDFEKMYKYFSAKDRLNKSSLQSIKPIDLVKTNWFKNSMKKILNL